MMLGELNIQYQKLNQGLQHAKNALIPFSYLFCLIILNFTNSWATSRGALGSLPVVLSVHVVPGTKPDLESKVCFHSVELSSQAPMPLIMCI